MYGWERLPDRYLHHEPCSACGSKDNFARYASGSGYCFGCGYFERTGQGSVESRVPIMEQREGSNRRDMGRSNLGTSSQDGVRPPPDDTVLGEYPECVVEWIKQYGLSVVDLIRHHVGWSKKREQLVYQFYGEGDDVVLWQARNFKAGTTHKDRFITGGSSADVIAAYSEGETGDPACIVEDCISAICVNNAGATGIPCLGSTMPTSKLARIARYWKTVYVWLDADKFKESQKIARQLGMLGVHSKVIFTDEDPKCYALDRIKGVLNLV